MSLCPGEAMSLRTAIVVFSIVIAASPAVAQLREVTPDPVGPRPFLFTLPPDLRQPTPEEPLPNSRRQGLQAPGVQAGQGKEVGLDVGGVPAYRPGEGRTLNGGVATGGSPQQRGAGFLSRRNPKPSVGEIEQ